MPSKPAAVRMPRACFGVGQAERTGRARRRRRAVRDRRRARGRRTAATRCRPMPRHANMTRRPPGRSAARCWRTRRRGRRRTWPRSGSTATSERGGVERSGPGRRPARRRRWPGRRLASQLAGPFEHARRQVDAEGRTAHARRGRRRGSIWPLPQPMSSTRSDGADRGGVEQRAVVARDRPVVALPVARPVVALVAVPRRGHLDVRHGVGHRHPRCLRPSSPVAIYSPWYVPYTPKGSICQRRRSSRPRPTRCSGCWPSSHGPPTSWPSRWTAPSAASGRGRRASSTRSPRSWWPAGSPRAADDAVGKRNRTIYSITPKGRRALAAWVAEPGEGPVLEFEQLMKVFFADHGTTDDLRRAARRRPRLGARTHARQHRGRAQLPRRPRPVPRTGRGEHARRAASSTTSSTPSTGGPSGRPRRPPPGPTARATPRPIRSSSPRASGALGRTRGALGASSPGLSQPSVLRKNSRTRLVASRFRGGDADTRATECNARMFAVTSVGMHPSRSRCPPPS